MIRAIGERAARRYFLSAEIFDASEAQRLGLLSTVVLSTELDSAIQTLLQHLLAGGSEAHRKIKELIREVSLHPLDEALITATARRIAEIRVSPEGRERIDCRP